MKFKIVKSKRRISTASVQQKENYFLLTVPDFLSQKHIEKIKNAFKKKIDRSQKRKNNLEKLADKLNQQYFKGKLKYRSINWSRRQKRILGSCSVYSRDIRLSDKLKRAPLWVIKAVLLHEMTHIIYPDHGRKFNQKMAEYRLLERAKGYLYALSQLEKERS